VSVYFTCCTFFQPVSDHLGLSVLATGNIGGKANNNTFFGLDNSWPYLKGVPNFQPPARRDCPVEPEKKVKHVSMKANCAIF